TAWRRIAPRLLPASSSARNPRSNRTRYEHNRSTSHPSSYPDSLKLSGPIIGRAHDPAKGCSCPNRGASRVTDVVVTTRLCKGIPPECPAVNVSPPPPAVLNVVPTSAANPKFAPQLPRVRLRTSGSKRH